MKKDIHIQKLKLIMGKLESFVKITYNCNQDLINRACQLNNEELYDLEESLR